MIAPDPTASVSREKPQSSSFVKTNLWEGAIAPR